MTYLSVFKLARYTTESNIKQSVQIYTPVRNCAALIKRSTFRDSDQKEMSYDQQKNLIIIFDLSSYLAFVVYPSSCLECGPCHTKRNIFFDIV